MNIHVTDVEPVIELETTTATETAADDSAWAFELGDPVSADLGPNGYVVQRLETLERDRRYLLGDKTGKPYPRHAWYRASQLRYRDPETSEIFEAGFERWNLRVGAMAKAHRYEAYMETVGDAADQLRAFLASAKLVTECRGVGLPEEDADTVHRLMTEAVGVLAEMQEALKVAYG